MNETEIAGFRMTFHRKAVRVRLWDDGGKIAGVRVETFEDFRPLLERVVSRGR